MAHVRKDSSKPTTTISWDAEILSSVENYWRTKGKKNRGDGVNELVKFGLKYVELLEKQRAKKRMVN